MDRRQALKAIGATAFVHLSSGEVLAIGRRAHQELQPSSGQRHSFRSLDPQQNETVITVSELIIPETDTPGAKAARVNEFVDVMLSEWFTEEERKRFLQGLAGLDTEEEAFVDLPSARQVSVLERAEEDALAKKLAKETGGGAVADDSSPAEQPFFAVMKWLTLYGYYTSKVGMEQELHYEVFPGSYDGCSPIRKFEV